MVRVLTVVLEKRTNGFGGVLRCGLGREVLIYVMET